MDTSEYRRPVVGDCGSVITSKKWGTPARRVEIETPNGTEQLGKDGPVTEISGAKTILVAGTRLAEEHQLVHLLRAH